MMRTTLKDKRVLCFFCVAFIYILFMSSEDGDRGISPEELEAYRSELSDWVRDNSEHLRRQQTERSNTIREVCGKYGINKRVSGQPSEAVPLGLDEEEWSYLKRVNWHYIYYSKPQSLIWCKIPKAGSSTWTYNFLRLAGLTTNSTRIHKLLRDHFPKQSSNRIFKDSFKFLVVRHPFERLLSAYRDKLEDLSRDLQARDGYYSTMYGRHIVSEYREKSEGNVTEPVEPSWKEFITYIINTPATKFDEHWMPMWMLCSPCIIRYHVVAKMETFAEDTEFVLEEAGLDNRLAVEWKHRTGTGGSTDLIADYYSQLTTSEIAELFHKYQLDFELYGYNPEPYFEIAQPDTP